MLLLRHEGGIHALKRNAGTYHQPRQPQPKARQLPIAGWEIAFRRLDRS
jgi:hypothetical protein